MASASEFGKTVIEAVSVIFGASVSDLRGQTRRSHLVRARGLAAYVLRLQRFSYTEIGELLHRDHSSVLYTHRKIAAAVAGGDEGLIADVDKIQAKVRAASELEVDRLTSDGDLLKATLAGLSSVRIRMDALQREVLDLRAEVEEMRAVKDGGVLQ